ncbi:hypothetical protein NC652_031812 [Populus alba x Populus x berolinensis]|nr:hypothetical protein NC652_031812 [Populus alba x Populus x berolinensis]
MLMSLRINPDCLNDRRSWMKNMGARSIGSDKSVQESIDDKDVESLAATSTVNTPDGQGNHNSRPLVGRSRILTHHEALETLEVLPRRRRFQFHRRSNQDKLIIISVVLRALGPPGKTHYEVFENWIGTTLLLSPSSTPTRMCNVGTQEPIEVEQLL